jgi:hypothetical protein
MNFYEEIKDRRSIAGSQMPRLRRHWISQGEASRPTGSQNLSRAVQGMHGQGTGGVAAPLRTLAWIDSEKISSLK